MVRLEHSPALGRVLRRDSQEELGIPTWKFIRDAIREGDADRALTLLDYECCVSQATHDSIVTFVDDVLTRLALVDEDTLYEILRKRYYPRVSHYLCCTTGVKELLEISTEMHRGHGGNLVVREEPDRYVVTLDPCGSGGRLRRARDVITTKRTYPWAWSKVGVPVYCTHCCVFWEVLPTEIRGHPARINLLGEKPQDPCVHLFYKQPELIPEEYFTRIGKTKPKQF